MNSPYYYMIIYAILLNTLGFLGIFHNIFQSGSASTLSYFSLVAFTLSILIFLYISFVRKYPIHLVLYIITLVALLGSIFLKRNAESGSGSETSMDE